MNIVNVRLSSIKREDNYRSKVRDVSELMASIKENGLLQPVGVSKVSNGYQLVFGNRRFEAIDKLGLKTIQAVVVDKTKNKTILNIIENMQREDVSMYEVGRAVNKLMTTDGLTKNEIIVRPGTNVSFLKKALDSFAVTPPAFRSKVKSMTYAGRGKSQGIISSSVSASINATAARYNLTKKQINEFYEHASQTQLSNLQIRNICSLLEEGFTLKNAFKSRNKVITLRAEITLPTTEHDRLTQKYGKGYVKYLMKHQRIDKINFGSTGQTITKIKKAKA